MRTLRERVARLIEAKGLPWRLSGDSVEVGMLAGGRRQVVHLGREGDTYLFRSTILPPREVTRDVRRWRDLARLAWRLNEGSELVTLAFDERDALVGMIANPAGTLDDAELEAFIRELAGRCDRVEGQLSGADAC